MKLLPHIDIVEPDRIAALLADPANFTWRAVDSETLDGFVPDLGLTNYVHPSIYRPPSVAAAGLPSQVRQRFWGTVEKQSDHTGWRYLGLVIYAAAGQPCQMEFRLGADEIGSIATQRADNRRHLLVIDHPIHFIGEMEVLQMRVSGPGAYRIEHFVLLKERPKPSSFAPHISQVTVRWQEQAAEQFTATLQWITAQVARCTVTALAPEANVARLTGEEAGAGRLHTVHLPNLRRNVAYTLQITATEALGKQATAIMTASVPPPPPASPALATPIEVFAPPSIANYPLPLTAGLPLASGQAFAVEQCTVQSATATWPAQARPLAYWPDGSIRWLQVDSILPLASTTAMPLVVNLNPGAGSTEGLRWQEDAEAITVTSSQLRIMFHRRGRGLPLRIERATGQGETLLDLISEANGGLRCALGNGLPLTPTVVVEMTLEERGPLRCVIKWQAAWIDEEGVAHLHSHFRLHIYDGQPFVKLVHRLQVISPALGAAASGHNQPEPERYPAVGSAVLSENGEENTLLKVLSLSLHLPWPKIGDAYCDGAAIPTATEQPWQLRQWDDKHYQLTAGQTPQLVSGQARGHLTLQGAPGALAVAVRHFWQNYPKGLQLTDNQVMIELLPAQPQADQGWEPADEDAWHRLHFWQRDGAYLLKAGMALTNEILLAFPQDDTTLPAIFTWFEQPPSARPQIADLNRTQALNRWGARHNSPMPQYESLVEQAIDAFAEDRAITHAYGQINFGDWYGESGWSWGNNEYDTAFFAYAEFLRGGDWRWARLGAEAARHLADVDTCNHSSDPSEVGLQYMHMAGHVGGYLPPYFRSKMPGSTALPSHTWVEGPVLHYLLTGDEFVHDSLRLTAQWLLQPRWFDAYDAANCREAGWHLTHLCMLARLGHAATALNAATLLVERVLEKQEPEGGWVHMLTESHCGCGYPRCRGEAGFMVVVLIGGLRRYHDLTGDPRVAQAIVGGAHWLIRHTYDAASGHFRYTSCAKRTVGGTYQHTQWVLVALADAYELSHDETIGHYLRQSLAVVGRFPEGLPHSGLGKAMAMQMRYMPSLLAVLAEMREQVII